MDEELRRRLLAIRETGDFVRLHAGPTEVEDELTARLVVLGPEHPHSAKVGESAAQHYAAEILAARSGGPRVHRNMLVFLAAGVARVEELRDAARTALAWDSIQRDRDSLRLDSVQQAQIDTRRQEWNGTVDQRIGETYQWLLVPSSEPGSPTISWAASRAAGSDPLAVRASRRLRSEESLITAYSGARLRMDLDRIPLWREDRVSVRDLWSFYSQYLYLPRMRDASVLLAAVADGVGLMTWRQDGLGYADGVDESAGRFVGLRAGEAVALVDPVGLIVRADAADAQLEAERAQRPTAPAVTPTEMPGPGAVVGEAVGGQDGPAGLPKRRSYAASLALSSLTRRGSPATRAR